MNQTDLKVYWSLNKHRYGSDFLQSEVWLPQIWELYFVFREFLSSLNGVRAAVTAVWAPGNSNQTISVSQSEPLTVTDYIYSSYSQRSTLHLFTLECHRSGVLYQHHLQSQSVDAVYCVMCSFILKGTGLYYITKNVNVLFNRSACCTAKCSH